MTEKPTLRAAAQSVADEMRRIVAGAVATELLRLADEIDRDWLNERTLSARYAADAIRLRAYELQSGEAS